MMTDLHRKKAAEIFGIPESEVTPEQRRYAKTVNYMNLYNDPNSLEKLIGRRRWLILLGRFPKV